MDREKLIELVQAAQAGSDDALQALYIDAAKSVYYLANKNLRDTHAAEDMVQEVFITVSEKIGTLKEPAAFYRWLNLITVRKCADVFRKHHEFLSDTEHDDELFDIEDIDTGVQPDAILDSVETRRMIVEVIDNLPPTQRICIYYYYYGRLTVQQISELLDVTPSAVKKRLAVGREKIKEAILQKEKDEGIKLYAAPLALTPILRMALDEYTMPEGVLDSIWQNIAQAIGIGDAGTGGTDATAGDGSHGGDASGQGPSDSGSSNSPAQAETAPGQHTEPGSDALQQQGGTEPATESPQAQPEVTGNEGQVSDTSGPSDTVQPDQPKGEPNMNNQPGNYQPQQPGQYPQQGQQPQYPQQGQYPQGGQPQGYPQGQPYNAAPNAAPPTPTPSANVVQGAAQAAGTGAAKTGMALGTKIALAAVSIVVAVGLAVGGAILIPRLLDGSPANDGVTGSQQATASHAVAIQGAPVQDGFAEEHEVTLTVNGEEYTGTYEGEYASGLFSGYGVWVYDRFRYEGYFENGVPNGEGTLYIEHKPSENSFSSGSETVEDIFAGTFKDGAAHGLITVTYVMRSGDYIVYEYEFDMGCPVSDDVLNVPLLYSDGSFKYDVEISVGKGIRMGCVPPWERSHL